MGCLLGGLAALLGLAVPASIARASLVGAYVTLALLAALAVLAVLANDRRRSDPDVPSRRSAALTTVAVATVVYAGVVAIIGLTG